jgi:hypothetical protein
LYNRARVVSPIRPSRAAESDCRRAQPSGASRGNSS